MERLIIWLFHFLFFVFQFQSASSSPLSSSPLANHSCSLDERSSLLQFKQMFTIDSSEAFLPSSWCEHDGYPSYAKTLSWNETTDCCSWDGVMCDASTGHVTGLDLSCSKLYGTIHPNTTLFQLSHLQQLNLAFNHFNFSPISPSFSRFTSLSHLNLSSSFLSGSIPSEISHLSKLVSLDLASVGRTLLSLESHHFKMLLKNLTQLQDLVLYQVNISGPLPESLGNLTRISQLILSLTGFNGQLPSTFSNLKQLTTLNFEGNYLNGEIPDFFAKLVKLKYLALGSNNFDGAFPCWVANLTQLIFLDISSNALTGPIPSNITGFRNLEMLSLSNNSLHGTLPSWLFTIPSFRELDLGFNQLTGQIQEFRRDSRLEIIDLSYNKLHGPIPQSVSGLVNLRVLYLPSNNLSGFLDLSKNNISVSIGSNANTTWPNLLPLSFPYFPYSLKFLELSHNKLIGEIPSSICNLSSLQFLVLSNNNFTGVIPQCLGNVSNDLVVLDLRMNSFHGAIPTMFANCNKLRSLNLYGNHLKGPVPRSLANCKSLKVLDLGKNNLSGAFPHWLESLPDLCFLVLKSNRFHGPIGTSGAKTPFPQLRIFDLSHNNFSGLLPERYFLNFKAMVNVQKSQMSLQYMGDLHYHVSLELVLKGVVIELDHILPAFTTIDFSYNNFRGEIPNEIGKLQGLRLLNLSQNSLSGHLSSLLGNITMLESLDLSSNQLTGEIPGELTSLTFLAVLNLSKNHLVGPIPHGKQFDTFQNDSYVGNSGLCGLPLSKRCGDSEAQEQPISQDDDDDDDDFASGFTWRIVLMGYGCGFLIGATMGFVMFLIGRPRWFTRIFGEEPRRKVARVS